MISVRRYSNRSTKETRSFEAKSRKAAMRSSIPLLSKLFLLLMLFSLVFAEIPVAYSPTTEQLAVNFSWTPRFIVIGNRVNFTAAVTGGNQPYTYSWDFGDGQTAIGISVIHAFATLGTYDVNLTATDSGTAIGTRVYAIVVNNWPAQQYGWVIKWNTTLTDGINISNVTFEGRLIIRDARFVAALVRYQERFCGPFYDEPYGIQAQIDIGNMAYQTFNSPSDPSFQIIYDWYVGGYNYRQAWRFHQSGRWDAEMQIGEGGCAIEHIYQPRLRVDLAVGDENQDYMSTYTPQGSWQTLLWEGDYVDNGARDASHNNTQWRLGDGEQFSYIVPSVTRTETDLPVFASKIILVRTRPNEIELFHSATLENPSRFANGEFAYRTDIALWFLVDVWDRGPGINPTGFDIVTLSFYPGY